jgi:hypothetical protein
VSLLDTPDGAAYKEMRAIQNWGCALRIFLSFCLLLVAAIRAGAQVGCPPPMWLTASSVSLVDKTNTLIAGLERRPDGSFNERNYKGYNPATTQQQAAVPQFQQNFFACAGLSPRTPSPMTGWVPGSDRLLGTQSHSVVGGNFLNNGTVFLACFGQCTGSNRIAAGFFMADGTIASVTTYTVGTNTQGLLAEIGRAHV